MSVEERSIVIHKDDCMGCGNCIASCPLSNPESRIFRDGGPILKLESGVSKVVAEDVTCWEHPEVPDNCDKCTSICPTGAIRIIENYNEKKYV